MTATTTPATRGRLRMMLEMIRFSHTIFALPFAALALLMALRIPEADGSAASVGWIEALALLLCMVFARSTAMAFNRLVDSRIDAANPRTAGRHLPAGLLSRREVTVFAIACAVGFVLACALFLPNWIPLAGALPVLAFLCGYSLAKRFTSAAHLWLGIALSLAPICVWLAVRGESFLEDPAELWPAVILAAAVALWVTGFDIIYACQDESFDRRAGLRSIPARLGTAGALRLAAVCHGAMVVGLLLLPWIEDGLGWATVYYVALALIAALLLYEHSLVRPDDLERVNTAFFHVNATISIVILVAAGIDSYLV
ncbi:UbiA-like polyprenyltransferase [Roseimaritima sediminicola]|uniref:UbiA-like polyprenyltransferase n=1 Tax=Roseimaritima sediminicola TaxID=2662066 RepID=UPI0012983E41|nr:UbiA-like polyprenyltransferase [Roseimaritima sediminicola]